MQIIIRTTSIKIKNDSSRESKNLFGKPHLADGFSCENDQASAFAGYFLLNASLDADGRTHSDSPLAAVDSIDELSSWSEPSIMLALRMKGLSERIYGRKDGGGWNSVNQRNVVYPWTLCREDSVEKNDHSGI